jgi:ribosomal protein L11 methyltransferase
MSDIGYTETKIYTTSAGVEPVLALLMNHGIEQVAVQDSVDLETIIAAKDELRWDYIDESLTGTSEAVVAFYTGADKDGDALLSEVKIGLMKLKSDELYGLFGSEADFGRLYTESLPLKDDWKEKWKENFEPFRATERIVVRPPWETPDADGSLARELSGADIVIRIDPGMAFGTGLHETTSMCLAAVEEALNGAGAPTSQVSLLDLGTGTGILAIAAAMLGASIVVAVEYDEDGLAAARDNIAASGLTDRITLIGGDITDAAVQEDVGSANASGGYDVIAANIHKNLLIDIMPGIAKVTRHGGRLILSGLLERDEKAVTKAAASAGFIVSSVIRKSEWLAICADFL